MSVFRAKQYKDGVAFQKTMDLHQDRPEKLVPHGACAQVMYCLTGVTKTRLAQVVYKTNKNAVYMHTRLTVKGFFKVC